MGGYAGRIQSRDKYCDLPVQRSGGYETEMALNLKAAKALGLTILLARLARVDEMIECTLYAALHESGNGPSRRNGHARNCAADWGQADVRGRGRLAGLATRRRRLRDLPAFKAPSMLASIGGRGT
jgi:hypothetical protein